MFDSDLSRRHFLGQVVDLDLLLCTGFDSERSVLILCHALFLCYIFTQRPMNDRKIEQSDGSCFVLQQLLADSIEKKSDSSRPDIYKALRPCWLSNRVSIARVMAHFPQVSRSLPVATAADLETPCVCARPPDPPMLCRSAAPRAWPLILQPNPSIVFSNSLREWLPDDLHWSAGAWTWTQTWTLPPDQWVVEVLSAPKPQKNVQINCVEFFFEFFLERQNWGLILRTAVSRYQPSPTGLSWYVFGISMVQHATTKDIPAISQISKSLCQCYKGTHGYFFLPFSKTVLPLFKHFAQLGSISPRL